MKIEEIRTLSLEDLEKQLETAHEELFNLRVSVATKQLVNHRQLRWKKKEIAQLKTIMRERALGIR